MMSRQAPSTQPNFLLFITDQHRADHLGCYGNPVLATPHIDSIAAEGCVFDDFHVATPICQPNRASLMTGRLPSAHGLRMNGLELSMGESTFVERLRDAGWQTALVGKSHLQNITSVPASFPSAGERRAHDARRLHPGQYGQEVASRWAADDAFDLTLPYYGFEKVALTIGHADEQQGHWRRWLRGQLPEAERRLIGPENAIPTPGLRLGAIRQAWRTRLPAELHPTNWIADRCIDVLGECAAADRPFFIQCSFPDPHHPYTPPGRYWDLYDPADVNLPPSFDTPLIDAPPPIAWLRQARARDPLGVRGYGAFACDEQEAREGIALNYGSIACMDDAIGRVLAHLQDLGLADGTVVMFTSDHGELLGDRGLMFKGGLHYDALTRVPFIWKDTADRRLPARAPALAQTTDIAPTVLARAGLAPTHGMQGRSLLDVAAGRVPAVRDHLLIEEESQRRDFGLVHRIRMRTLRTRTHRFTLYDGQRWGELYDLREDPNQLRNLWSQPQARSVKEELASQLAWAMLDMQDESPYPLASA